MGPILYFRGCRDRRWHLSALVAAEEAAAPPLRTEGEGVAPQRLPPLAGHNGFWRYDFSLPQDEAESDAAYELAGQRWRVRVPAIGGALRLAYTSCNGVEEITFKDPRVRNERWCNLAAEHERRPFHLLIQGGDQLYADSIWTVIPSLAEWRRLSWRRRLRAPFTPAMAKGLADYYDTRYRWLWSQRELRPLLATIPSLMMWDDHDIFDNWGSYEAELQACPVFQGIWSIAREHFAIFQLGARADDLPPGFGDRGGARFDWAFRIGPTGIVAPDLRSERTRRQVMGEAGWRFLNAALEEMGECRHLLFVSTVPVVHAYLSPVEHILRALPGRQNLLGDLRDQWRSFRHREEWLRLLRLLFDFSTRTRAQVTVLSGEIHLGALGRIDHGAVAIHQLTASGVVNVPPPALATVALDLISRRPSAVAPGVTLRMLPFPGLGRRRYLRARNWLSLEVAADGGLDAAWHAEGQPEPFRYAIPALDR